MDKAEITGAVLAGGRGQRMGGEDKGLLQFRGRPLVTWSLDALRPLCAQILINANRHVNAYQKFGCPVIRDLTESFDGPLAGVLSAMRSAGTPYVLIVPCDAPLVTAALLERLCETMNDVSLDVCVVDDGTRIHPLFMMVRRKLADDLSAYLAGGERKVLGWLERQRWKGVDFSHESAVFANLNTPDDLVALQGYRPPGFTGVDFPESP